MAELIAGALVGMLILVVVFSPVRRRFADLDDLHPADVEGDGRARHHETSAALARAAHRARTHR